MIKEKSSILKLNVAQKKGNHRIKNSLYESTYALFCIMLEDPIESFWFEFFLIFCGYFQLIVYLFDSVVNKFLFLYFKL